MACSMLGSAISMCAGSTTACEVRALKSSQNSSSISLEALRREPWSTITMPTPSWPAAARHASRGDPLVVARLPQGRSQLGPAATGPLEVLALKCDARRSAHCAIEESAMAGHKQRVHLCLICCWQHQFEFSIAVMPELTIDPRK